MKVGVIIVKQSINKLTTNLKQAHSGIVLRLTDII